MTTRRHVLGLGAAVAAGSVLAPTPALADYTTRVDPARGYGRWQGWGASLSWWANVFGRDSTLADIFYTTRWVRYHGSVLPGLGLNVVRYNLGASMWQPAWPGGPRMVASPNLPAFRKMQGYWVNWLSSDPADPDSWNWSNDAEQRAMLRHAHTRGADVFQMFSVSPIWWMCRNHNPSGAADGGENLQDRYQRQHARYIATVARYARDHWGIRFDSVEPFNEPSRGGHKANGRAEGCYIGALPDRPVQQRIIHHLRDELDSRGLGDVAIAASDELSYRRAGYTWTNMATLNTRRLVGQVNTHGYQYDDDGPARSALYDNVRASGKRLWQSEYGEQYEHGLYLAYHVALDLRRLHPTAWCYWQPVDGQITDPATGHRLSWGLLKAVYSFDRTRKAGSLGEPDPYPGTDPYVANKYFVLAQYTRHIRPGMRIIDSGSRSTVAAYDALRRRLVLVTVRGNTPQRVTYDLSRFATVGNVVRRRVTDADPGYRIGRQYAAVPAVPVRGKRLAVDFSANSVQSIEIDNVRP
ncbi:glycoside hydrolase [Streptomyces lycii]|uniref:Beta-1,6-galactanase n=1 Tax=Streptomyces lycii TaxID=2654337 RepID=A0ABQ7FQ40_9ACTN|nr:glycoside hydrolase [Streptomyces lycii]KAF4411042.1 beta-1,6-galactanase [Streptomyces lycii]